jgi:hypothetical protein
MLQMLSEMICSEKLLGMVAFSKFMHFLQMHNPKLPILLRSYCDLVAVG